MPSATQRPLELIFLGTGTSSSLPHVECLTAGPNDKQCRSCLSTLKPEGKHNIRRNTGAVIRTEGKDGELKTIVIDVGKNFQASALEWFPKYGLRKIDGVLITHPHADAMFGLDDLRVWTLRGAIQPHIDLYVSETTYIEVQRSFPYLVSREFASGGGDVPEFKWHVIADGVPFEVADTGIEVTPFSVHHGRYFSILPPPGCAPTPRASTPTKPVTDLPRLTESLSLKPSYQDKLAPVETIHPYLCFGFKIQDAVLYISDVSYIPDEAWAVIEGRPSSQTPEQDHISIPKKMPVLVVDCLRLHSHTSHFGIADAVTAARRIGALRTYWTGFTHDIGHDEYVTIGEALDGRQLDPQKKLTDMERKGIKILPEGAPLWARPAHDGLRVTALTRDDETEVKDDTYDLGAPA